MSPSSLFPVSPFSTAFMAVKSMGVDNGRGRSTAEGHAASTPYGHSLSLAAKRLLAVTRRSFGIDEVSVPRSGASTNERRDR
ncbi:hypothetical protein [Chitinasiproducens palmae]|uniref:Uncharacterized protein n=1 Tax=Chitinasiproducens palmae TaxID=1770053 RepID=A0A1H2PSR9_9BURK|nr:hypothetical protein [Chitinasiproducens palmae]SDV49649.1 hypothetical protein SAMN05216551_10921 [Chitinasiproducens palmae]